MTKGAVRKANRSGMEICPVSRRMCRLVEHHIFGRKVLDWQAPWNTCWISPEVHDEVHADPPGIIIEGWFPTSEGRILFWHKNGEKNVVSKGVDANRYGSKKD